MSYKTTFDGIKNLIESLELGMANKIIDFNSVSPNEYNRTFILKTLSGSIDEDINGDLGDRLYDIQEWNILVAFSRGEYSMQADLIKLHNKKEEIIQKIDNPSNWSSFARTLRYKGWELEELSDYFILKIYIELTDTITY